MENIDYQETFSPTAQMSSLRMLVQSSVDQNMSIQQMDVKSAYLNAPIDYELVLRYGVALVNECGLKQWYIMY